MGTPSQRREVVSASSLALSANGARRSAAQRSAAKLASLCRSPALATRSPSALIPPSPRTHRPGPSIRDTKTGAARKRREDVEIDHIRSMRLKPLPVASPLPLCSNCGRSSNGFFLVRCPPDQARAAPKAQGTQSVAPSALSARLDADTTSLRCEGVPILGLGGGRMPAY